jgi:tetratricopeptide (TPR) repeat protein
MSSGLIELVGADILASIEGGDEARFSAEPAIAKLQAWSKRYDKASVLDNEGDLSAIGREMFAWLDESGWASAWALGSGDRNFEIRVKGAGGAEEEALLDAPWELLSRADGPPLAFDEIQLFIVARRIGAKAAQLEPRHGDLQLIFMAAAPEGQHELDYEAEETAILDATRLLPMRVVVEETGALEFLGLRLTSDEAPFEALHLSCHGDIDREKGPFLLLETAEGGEDRVGPGALVGALGADPPPLVVLSACRTAERGGSPGARFPGEKEGGGADRLRDSGQPAAQTGPELATPFVRRLAATIANVVGWDGSVYDADATAFATHFYKELAGRSPAPRAAAVARRALLNAKATDSSRGRHWHLARVYIGPRGGGPLCGHGKPKRRSAADGAKLFLDKARQRVPVATRAEFVGRRREIQRVLRSFRNSQSGVLIHGMGALGKSSLAARVQSRMSQHRPVVIFERYDALAIFDEVLAALDPKIQAAEKAQWREAVKADPPQLVGALQSWLSDPFDTKPILLITDDLERILETPSQSDTPTGVLLACREALKAVLLAFDRATTQSRLLLTSRYEFRLPDGGGGDLAASLVRVPLKPMAARERIKQWRAAERSAGRETAELDETGNALLSRALAAAAGNPGLQAILTKPILAREFAAAEQALRQIDVYCTTGAPPKEIEALIAAGKAKDSANALTAFFARLSFATYRDALTDDQARQLGAATHFTADVPIPLPALAAAGQALDVEAPDKAIGRLLGLGLLDDWGMLNAVPHAAANPLARPLAPPIDAADFPRLARAALAGLVAAWKDPRGGFPRDPRAIEAARFAVAAGAESAILEDAAFSGAAWLEVSERRTREALRLLASAFATFPDGYAIEPDFLRLGLECADRLGEMTMLEALLAAPVRPPISRDPKSELSHASLNIRRAERLIRTGQIAEAEALTRNSIALFDAAGDDGLTAIASGQIADILTRRGELDEALRIRREQQLPVYERLGDVRSRAVTMGQIADVLMERGDVEEALRIRREEELPVYDRLGDARSRAITIGKIADILWERGHVDEALHIRREEELKVYERLGDVRARALTIGKIADILRARGDLDEALRIRREEELPVLERLGDVRSCAITLGKIADILHARGDLNDALHIRREEELPVFDRLGDIRSRAFTLGKIADILMAHGDFDEALRIRREEELPVYDRLGDVRSRAVATGKIADILQARGDLEEALRIWREELLPVFERLGDVRSRTVTMSRIADILQARGDFDDALHIRREELLPVFERLGDIHSRAITMGRIADILQARGDLDEALRLRREEELPVYNRLGDVWSRATALQKIAAALLQNGGLENGSVEEIFEALVESFTTAVKLSLPDGIANIGVMLAQVMATGSLRDEALAVLDQSEAAFQKLGKADGVARVRHLRERIEKR